MKVLLIVLFVTTWLAPQVYFLYCLEKRRPWALELARTLTLLERLGIDHRLP